MAQSEFEKMSSSSGEELSSEGSESESEADPPPPSSIKTQPTSKSSSESDGDSPPKQSEKSDPNIKPLASKPMDDRKPRPKNPIFLGKRKASEVESEDRESKIEKKENGGEKKQLFQRLWSEEDEIQLIKGMINYVEKKSKDPIGDVNDFHEFVKSSLMIDVNNAQMSAKVRRLKAKFMNNKGKIEQNGKVRSLSNPHEKKMYELSEKLWGKDRNKSAAFVSCSTKKVNNAKPQTNQKRKNNNSVEANVNNGIGLRQRGGPMRDEDIMNEGLRMVSGPKKVELQEKWDDLKMQEFKHFLKKLELMREQADVILNAMKESEAS